MAACSTASTPPEADVGQDGILRRIGNPPGSILRECYDRRKGDKLMNERAGITSHFPGGCGARTPARRVGTLQKPRSKSLETKKRVGPRFLPQETFPAGIVDAHADARCFRADVSRRVCAPRSKLRIYFRRAERVR